MLFISFRKAISLIKRKFISLSVTEKVMLMDEPTSKMSRIHIANEKCVLYMYFKYCYLLTYISDITLFIVYYNRFVESKKKKITLRFKFQNQNLHTVVERYSSVTMFLHLRPKTFFLLQFYIHSREKRQIQLNNRFQGQNFVF